MSEDEWLKKQKTEQGGTTIIAFAIGGAIGAMLTSAFLGPSEPGTPKPEPTLYELCEDMKRDYLQGINSRTYNYNKQIKENIDEAEKSGYCDKPEERD